MCLMGMILLATTQIILRNFFHTGLEGAEVILRHMVLWLGFLGATIATREGKHINIDIASRLLPRRLGYINYMIINFIASAVTGFLAVAAFRFLAMELDTGEIIHFGFDGSIFYFSFPVWYLQMIIPIGFTVMVFRFLQRGIAAARLTVRRGGEE